LSSGLHLLAYTIANYLINSFFSFLNIYIKTFRVDVLLLICFAKNYYSIMFKFNNNIEMLGIIKDKKRWFVWLGFSFLLLRFF